MKKIFAAVICLGMAIPVQAGEAVKVLSELDRTIHGSLKSNQAAVSQDKTVTYPVTNYGTRRVGERLEYEGWKTRRSGPWGWAVACKVYGIQKIENPVIFAKDRAKGNGLIFGTLAGMGGALGGGVASVVISHLLKLSLEKTPVIMGWGIMAGVLAGGLGVGILTGRAVYKRTYKRVLAESIANPQYEEYEGRRYIPQ